MATVVAAEPGSRRIGHVRWLMCGLIFLVTTINYVDRNALSVLKTTLQGALGWSDADYGWITFGFTCAYAIFPALAGRMIDALGVKKGLAIGVVLWSLMCMAHGVVTGVIAFVIVRFLLGAAEATNFPAALKAIAQWFPQKERTLATGIFNSGTNLGVMLSFAAVGLAGAFGWRWAFVVVGALGLLWLLFWSRGYFAPEDHPRLSAAEKAYIEAGRVVEPAGEQVHWIKLLRYREIWPYLAMKFLTDPVWWFYLFWLPSYLERERGQNPMTSALLLIIIYTGATIGSLTGGWLAGFLMGRGWRIANARYLTMLLPAAFMPAAIGAYYTDSFALSIALIALATGCHQWWSANVFNVATDLFPGRVVGSVTGLGATAGGIGGMFLTLLAGASIQWLGNQQAVFIWAGLMHPLSWILLRMSIGREFKPVDVAAPMNLAQPSRGLQLGGVVALAIGLLAASVIALNWAAAVDAARSVSAVTAAMTASCGVVVIGAILLYAGAGHRSLATAG